MREFPYTFGDTNDFKGESPIMAAFTTMMLPAVPTGIANDGSVIRELPAVEHASLAHCTLAPGQTAKAIRHVTVSEIWYVVQGLGQIWRKLGDEEQVDDLIPGTAITIPVGMHFQFRCTSQEPLTLLLVSAPPWPGGGEAFEVEGYWEA
jgi:mannose-6-phosphate isomerase-like protein (cupin superfamily)